MAFGILAVAILREISRSLIISRRTSSKFKKMSQISDDAIQSKHTDVTTSAYSVHNDTPATFPDPASGDMRVGDANQSESDVESEEEDAAPATADNVSLLQKPIVTILPLAVKG